MPEKIAIIGECMLELTRQPDAADHNAIPMGLGYGGDTLNTAVYMARLGMAVDYVTALGDDNMSAWMLEQWRAEGVGCELVERSPGSVPGLYMVEVDSEGERSFYYWRDNAPARRLFDEPEESSSRFAKLQAHNWLCLSGITLAIYSEDARQRLFAGLAGYREQGGKVVFDDNYRPRLWPDITTAQAAYEAMYRLTDIALPTYEDEQAVFGDATEAAIVERLLEWGVSEVALKMDAQGCMVASKGSCEVIASNRVDVVDSTAAGDSFNAGYLAARLRGATPQQAAVKGHELASVVIQHRGAIIPAAAMP